VLNLFGLIGGGIQPFVTHRLGNRALTLIGSAICVVALVVVGLLDEASVPYLVTVAVGIFIFGHSFGPGAQGKTMAALSYPTSLRGLGTGFAESASRVGSILGFYVFPLVVAVLGLSGTMLVLALVPLTMFVVVLIARWDPRDVDVEGADIEPATAA
jgi:predicted MFS family arabinose efflux permease